MIIENRDALLKERELAQKEIDSFDSVNPCISFGVKPWYRVSRYQGLRFMGIF